MSLVRIALRMAAVQALKGRTDVGDNVLDSEIGAVDVGADGAVTIGQTKPFITVYTDAARAGVGEDVPDTARVDMRALRVNGLTEIVFEAGITAAMVSTDRSTDESVIAELGTPATDAGFEFQLDLIGRQIGDALDDPDNEWAEVLRRLCLRFTRIERARTSSAEGQRVAAHQIRITAELVVDPVKGEALAEGSAMAAFFALAETSVDPDVASNIATMRALLGPGAYEWKGDHRRYGMNRAEMDAMLLDTPAGAEADVGITERNVAPAEPALS